MQCLTDAVASWWVPMWTAVAMNKQALETQNNEIRLSLAHQDMAMCRENLDIQVCVCAVLHAC